MGGWASMETDKPGVMPWQTETGKGDLHRGNSRHGHQSHSAETPAKQVANPKKERVAAGQHGDIAAAQGRSDGRNGLLERAYREYLRMGIVRQGGIQHGHHPCRYDNGGTGGEEFNCAIGENLPRHTDQIDFTGFHRSVLIRIP